MPNPEEFIDVVKLGGEVSEHADIPGLADLCKSGDFKGIREISSSTDAGLKGTLPDVSFTEDASALLSGDKSAQLIGNTSAQLIGDTSAPLSGGESEQLSAQARESLDAATKPEISSEAMTRLSSTLTDKGISQSEIDKAMGIFKSNDLNPRALKLVQDAVSTSKNPSQTLNATADWIKSGTGALPTTLRDAFAGKAGAFRLPASDIHTLLNKVADTASASGKLTDTSAAGFTELASKVRQGDVMLVPTTALIGEDGLFGMSKGLVNTSGRNDICTACTAAGIKNDLLGTGDAVDFINQSVNRNIASLGESYRADIVPVTDQGVPQITAEHVQASRGFAGASLPAKLKPFEPDVHKVYTPKDAVNKGDAYVESTTGLKRARFADLDTLPDGHYPLAVEIPAGPKLDDTNAHIEGMHSMYAVKQGGQITYFDPLYGRSSTDFNALRESSFSPYVPW